MESDKRVSKEAVISKLKDDGGFDLLRLKIIRLIKLNEDLRNNIILVVKQSAALNSANAENMKPRQLCDAIHDEVCEKMMNQISDSLWEIIRSGDGDGMKTEITETVQSVYNQLLNPPISGQVSASKVAESSGSVMVSEEKKDGSSHERQEHHPPGNVNEDSLSETPQQGATASKSVDQGRETIQSNGSLRSEDGDQSPPPGYSSLGKRKQPSNGCDEDPDIPPGFG